MAYLHNESIIKPTNIIKIILILYFSHLRNYDSVTCGGLLVESFLKENYTTEVLKGTRSAEKKLPQCPPVCLGILNVDAGKTLADCASRLISGKDTLPRGANIGSILNELICRECEIHYVSQTHPKICSTKFKN